MGEKSGKTWKFLPFCPSFPPAESSARDEKGRGAGVSGALGLGRRGSHSSNMGKEGAALQREGYDALRLMKEICKPTELGSYGAAGGLPILVWRGGSHTRGLFDVGGSLDLSEPHFSI